MKVNYNQIFPNSAFQINFVLDVVTPGVADSSGDFYALQHDGTSWSVKEYGSKENAYSLCMFIGMYPERLF